MKKNRDYWKQRRLQIDRDNNKKTDETIKIAIKEYEKVKNSLERRLNAFYGKYSHENVIDRTIAKKLLNKEDMRSFFSEIEKFKKNIKKSNINPNLYKKIDSFSKRIRIKRDEALLFQIENEIEILSNKLYLLKKNLYSDIIKKTYYKNMFLLQSQIGMSFEFNKLNTEDVETIINMKWEMNNFSNRIWYNKEKLISELRKELMQMFIKGEHSSKAANRLAKTMNTSLNRTKNLLSTESAFVSSVSKEKFFKEANVKEYEISATLDSRTTDICQSMDGQIFKTSERTPGVNAEPFHWRCRTTSIPKVNKDYIFERIGKDKSGNVIHVPGNWTYEEFSNKYM